MNVIGIIAEYNPFHNGHLYQINKIKELYKDSIIIVILNGNYTLRGEMSIINKWDKTKIALDNNIDLVIELPIFYGINNADIFSKGALEILNDLKIDTLVFGSELNNIKTLTDIVNTKLNNKNYNKLVKEYLDKGLSYPKASSDAINKLTNTTIDTPNDILALSYIEEIIKNNYKVNPVSIKRTNDYHSKDLNTISSATAIRDSIKNNIDISNAVPDITLKYINEPIFIDNFFNLLKYKILSCNDLTIYHGIIEGIENRFKKYITECNTLEELIMKVKTKRYTYNRIKRTLLYVLLDIKKDDVKNIKNYIRPLGFNNKGIKYLNKIKKELTLPLINNYSKNKDILKLEYKADSIYALGFKNINKMIKYEYNKPIKK